MKVIDLTHKLENGMNVWPGCPSPNFTWNGNVAEGDMAQVTTITFTTHTGTHMDCPTHMMADGFHADETDPAFFIGKGLVIDARNYGANEEMGMEIFDGYDLDGVEFLFICNGWDKYWNTPKFFEYPYIKTEVAEFLRDHPTIRGLCLETGGPDPVAWTDFKNHKTFFQNRKQTIVENLKNVDQLIGKSFTFVGLPLPIQNGDGSSIRAIAILDEE